MVESDVQYVNQTLTSYPKLHIPITQGEVELAIFKLSNKGASNEDGLKAGHLKNAKAPSGRFLSTIINKTITAFLSTIINKTITESKATHQLKCSLTHPIQKKNKPINILANVQNISITPIAGKILNSITLTHQKEARDTTHVLQCDFTEGKSYLDSALLIAEFIAESKDTDTLLYIASLDIQKP